MIKVNIRGHEIFLTNEIKDYAVKKLDKLCRKFKQIIDVDLFLEENHNKKESTAAVAGATVHIPGKDLNGKAMAKTIFAAIDELEEKLERQLEKDKDIFHNTSNKRISESKTLIRRLFRQE
jgi:putative sigma-54 modulation protein